MFILLCYVFSRFFTQSIPDIGIFIYIINIGQEQLGKSQSVISTFKCRGSTAVVLVFPAWPLCAKLHVSHYLCPPFFILTDHFQTFNHCLITFKCLSSIIVCQIFPDMAELEFCCLPDSFLKGRTKPLSQNVLRNQVHMTFMSSKYFGSSSIRCLSLLI